MEFSFLDERIGRVGDQKRRFLLDDMGMEGRAHCFLCRARGAGEVGMIRYSTLCEARRSRCCNKRLGG